MRVIVAGVDPDGRSCVLRDGEVQFDQVAPGLAAFGLFRTFETPPPARPLGHGELVDLGVEAGLCSWNVWRHDPRAEFPMHHTDSLDLDVILEGSVELVLDDGVHPLERGDCLVVQGVDHAWRAGEQGCVMVALNLGSAPAR
jgi:quercetin dioxygenase-like cupin family protein